MFQKGPTSNVDFSATRKATEASWVSQESQGSISRLFWNFEYPANLPTSEGIFESCTIQWVENELICRKEIGIPRNLVGIEEDAEETHSFLFRSFPITELPSHRIGIIDNITNTKKDLSNLDFS